MAILYIFGFLKLSLHFFLSSFSSTEKHDYVFKQKLTIFPHLSEISSMTWPVVLSPQWERLHLKTVFVTKPVSDTATKPPRTSLSARAWECTRTLRPHTIADLWLQPKFPINDDLKTVSFIHYRELSERSWDWLWSIAAEGNVYCCRCVRDYQLHALPLFLKVWNKKIGWWFQICRALIMLFTLKKRQLLRFTAIDKSTPVESCRKK